MIATRSQKMKKRVYVELVRSLYTTLVPTTIMSVGYVAAQTIFAQGSRDGVFTVCAVLGVIAGATRILVTIIFARESRNERLKFDRARRIERYFAASYIQFAVLLGVSGAYVLSQDEPQFHILMVCLLVGYGAGVATGVGLRPRIALISLAVGIVPGTLALLLHREPSYVATSLMMMALLVGASQSLLGRFRTTTAEISKRLAFETLARRDELTRLPNRLALREWFEELVRDGDKTQLGVYCLDLDGFKPVNDIFGHPAGDGVLKETGARLARFAGRNDIVARLGGDEFVIIQRGVTDRDSARAAAICLREIIAQPHSVRGHEVKVSCSIGYTICAPLGDLDDILEMTDQALYLAKKNGGIESVGSLASRRAA